MITVFLNDPVGDPEATPRNYNAPDPFVFPAAVPSHDEDCQLSCLSIIRYKKGEVVSMKIVMRNHVAE